MEKIEIQRVAGQDISKLQKIGRETFYETFASHNSEEDMRSYLDESFAGEKITAEVADPNVEFYFAELNNEVVGYLKLNFGNSQTELKEERGVEIERIYVLRNFMGKRWARRFMKKQ